MKIIKSFTFTEEVIKKLDTILDYYINNLGLPFNYSTALEYIINNEYIDIQASKLNK